MLKAVESFILANHESTDCHDTKLKQIEQSFKLKETSMGEYHFGTIFIIDISFGISMSLWETLRGKETIRADTSD